MNTVVSWHNELISLFGFFYIPLLLLLPFFLYYVVVYISKITIQQQHTTLNVDVSDKIIVRKYFGNEDTAHEQFIQESVKLAAHGYRPTSQSYAPGNWGCGCFLIALLCAFALVGILIFIFMLIVKPEGCLCVTFEKSEQQNQNNDEKTCPMCAEQIKKAARICRYCSYDFTK